MRGLILNDFRHFAGRLICFQVSSVHVRGDPLHNARHVAKTAGSPDASCRRYSFTRISNTQQLSWGRDFPKFYPFIRHERRKLPGCRRETESFPEFPEIKILSQFATSRILRAFFVPLSREERDAQRNPRCISPKRWETAGSVIRKLGFYVERYRDWPSLSLSQKKVATKRHLNALLVLWTRPYEWSQKEVQTHTHTHTYCNAEQQRYSEF